MIENTFQTDTQKLCEITADLCTVAGLIAIYVAQAIAATIATATAAVTTIITAICAAVFSMCTLLFLYLTFLFLLRNRLLRGGVGSRHRSWCRVDGYVVPQQFFLGRWLVQRYIDFVYHWLLFLHLWNFRKRLNCFDFRRLDLWWERYIIVLLQLLRLWFWFRGLIIGLFP